MTRLDVAVLNFSRGIRYSVDMLWEGDEVGAAVNVDGRDPIVSPAFTSAADAIDALAAHIENITEGEKWLVR